MITLPDPEDIQVASRWPEVNEFRAALLRADRLRWQADVERQTLEAADRYRPGDLRHRDRVYARYREAVAASQKAAMVMLTAQDAAEQVSAAATERVLASVEAYRARLARERAADRERQARDEEG